MSSDASLQNNNITTDHTSCSHHALSLLGCGGDESNRAFENTGEIDGAVEICTRCFRNQCDSKKSHDKGNQDLF